MRTLYVGVRGYGGFGMKGENCLAIITHSGAASTFTDPKLDSCTRAGALPLTSRVLQSRMARSMRKVERAGRQLEQQRRAAGRAVDGQRTFWIVRHFRV